MLGWLALSTSSDNEVAATCLHSVAAAITPHQRESEGTHNKISKSSAIQIVYINTGPTDSATAERAWSNARQLLFAHLAPSTLTTTGALEIVIGKIKQPFAEVGVVCFLSLLCCTLPYFSTSPSFSSHILSSSRSSRILPLSSLAPLNTNTATGTVPVSECPCKIPTRVAHPRQVQLKHLAAYYQ